MTITEPARHRLYEKLEGLLGMDDASTLMAHLPPVGWADIATRADLDQLHDRIYTDLADIRIEMANPRTDLHRENAAFRDEMRREFAAFRDELRAENAAFRDELRAENAAFRDELRAENAAFRDELRAEFTAFRDEVHRDQRRMLVQLSCIVFAAMLSLLAAVALAV